MAKPSVITNPNNRQTKSIANGEALSEAFDLRESGFRGGAIVTPSTWTDARLSFQFSQDSSTWYPLRDEEGALVVISGIQTAEAGIYFMPAKAGWELMNWNYMRVRSTNTASEAAVNQGATRSLTFVGKV